MHTCVQVGLRQRAFDLEVGSASWMSFQMRALANKNSNDTPAASHALACHLKRPELSIWGRDVNVTEA